MCCRVYFDTLGLFHYLLNSVILCKAMIQFVPCVGFIFILLFDISQSGESISKACYGVSVLPCAGHDLVCASGSVAIYEAYYTVNTECRTAVSNCDVNLTNLSETGDHHEFDKSEMAFLYSNCSFKTRCRYLAPRRMISFQFNTFSVVKYKCIRDSFSACSSVNEYQMNSTSLFWNESETQTQCGCAVSTLTDNINVSVYALDMRPNKTQLCSSVTISIHDQPLQMNCSSPILPTRLIAFTSLSRSTEIDLNVRESSYGGFIWIRVQGTHPFDLQCPAPVTSTVAGSVSTTLVTSSSSTSSDSTETTQYISTSTQPTSPGTQVPAVMSSSSVGSVSRPLTTESRFPGGIFVAGVGCSALVVVIIVIVLYVLIIRRRYNITAKTQESLPTPATTYEGLSPRDPTYDIIKRNDCTYVNSTFATSDNDNSRQYEDM